MADLATIVDAVFNGRMKEIGGMVQVALDAGLEPGKILNEALVKGMDVVTQKWREGQIYVPEVLRAAKTMQTGMDVLRPHLVGGDATPKASYAIGTVKGDLHDIGKNLVGLMIESVGYKVVNLGTDVDPQRFVEQVKNGVPCIGISALLTTTIPQMRVVIEAIKEAGLRDKCKIWVGGAPVTQEYADEVGADFYSADAAQCIDQLKAVYG